MNARFRTWLQLFRAPNLFTVPGDPLMGFLLANVGVPTAAMFPVIGASLCFYAAGLLDNDLADLAEDRAERPERPLPSGGARVRTVWAVTLGLVLLGLGLCALSGGRTLAVGGALVAAVALYNHGLKKIPGLGALNMGLCRSLSVLLGAFAAPAQLLPEALVAAALIGFYIAAITNLARFETRASSPAWAKWLPAAVLGVACVLVQREVGTKFGLWEAQGIGTASGLGDLGLRMGMLVAFIFGFYLSKDLGKPGAPLPPAIGKFIRLLLLIQAAFCAHTGLFGLIFAALLVALYPVSRAVGRRFYAS